MALNLLKGAQVTSQQNSAPDTRIRFVDPKVFFAQAKVAPLITLLQKINRLVRTTAIKCEWVEEDMGTPTTTLHTTINDSTTTVIVAAGAGVMFDAGDILWIPNAAGGEQMLVTGRSNDNLTVVRSFGAGAAAAATEGAQIVKLGSAYAENATSGVGLKQKSTMPHNYTQIFRTPIEMSRTEALIGRYERGSQEAWAKNKKDAWRFHMEAKERAFINGDINYDSATDRRACNGVLRYLETREDMSSAFTRAKMEAFLETVMRNGGDNYYLFGSGTFMRAFNTEILGNSAMNITPATKEWGLDVIRYHSPFGSLNVVYHKVMTQILEGQYGGCAMLLDLDLVTEYYITKTTYRPNIQPNDQDGRKDEFLEECCPAVHNQSNHGFLWGI
jgi:hypothetical protein